MLRYYTTKKVNKTLKVFYLIFILTILTVGNVIGQSITNLTDTKSQIEWIDETTANLTITDGMVVQHGKVNLNNDKYTRDGEWILSINDEIRTRIMYKNGNVLWIQSYPLNKTFTNEIIRIHRLEKRIAYLESKLENI